MTNALSGRLMIIEDDPTLSAVMAELFQMNGLSVDLCHSLSDFRQHYQAGRYDLLLLDLALLDEDGLQLIQQLRPQDKVPIFVISAKSDPATRRLTLKLGADDFIAKPFDGQELLLKVSNFLARMGLINLSLPADQSLWRLGAWNVDPAARQVINTEGEIAELTRAEFDLLFALVKSGGRPLGKAHLARVIGDESQPGRSDSVTVLVHRIRKKLGDKQAIQTLSGVGYRVQAFRVSRAS